MMHFELLVLLVALTVNATAVAIEPDAANIASRRPPRFFDHAL